MLSVVAAVCSYAYYLYVLPVALLMGVWVGVGGDSGRPMLYSSLEGFILLAIIAGVLGLPLGVLWYYIARSRLNLTRLASILMVAGLFVFLAVCAIVRSSIGF